MHNAMAIYEKEYLQYVSPAVRNSYILCLDPGETVGWALFFAGHVLRCGQLAIQKQLAQGGSVSYVLNTFFDDLVGLENCASDMVTPTTCVVEDYVVYAHKLQANMWSSLFTVRLIGALQFLCSDRAIPVVYQMAAEAKFFASDEKLRRWGIFQEKLKHANDAIRHGIYYMLRKSGIAGRDKRGQ